MLKDKFLRNDGADGADTCDYVSYPSGTLFVPFPSKVPNRWYSYMPPVSEIIGTGCSCYYAHGVWNLVCTVCVCSHLPSPPQKEKRHKVKMPCASMLKCQCLTSVVNVWKGEFDMTEICFLQCLCEAESLYRTDVLLHFLCVTSRPKWRPNAPCERGERQERCRMKTLWGKKKKAVNPCGPTAVIYVV